MTTTTHPISPYADTLDSGDIIARIAALQAVRTTADEQAELDALLSLAEDASEADDWEDGAILIHDHYFPRYAQELAEDCGDIPADLHWPLTHIDWGAAAEELQRDYLPVSYKGYTFWIR